MATIMHSSAAGSVGLSSNTLSLPPRHTFSNRPRDAHLEVSCCRRSESSFSRLSTCKTRCGLPYLLRFTVRQQAVSLLAARRRQVDDDLVELDDEDRWGGQVEFAVKAGLVLLAAAIARSLLGVALTVGTIVFGLYVAAKLYTRQEPEEEAPRPFSPQPAPRGRKPKQQSRDDDGLSDVWFEDKPKAKRKSRKSQAKQSDDTSW